MCALFLLLINFSGLACRRILVEQFPSFLLIKHHISQEKLYLLLVDCRQDFKLSLMYKQDTALQTIFALTPDI